jgi:Fe-S cluster assembly protein SufD
LEEWRYTEVSQFALEAVRLAEPAGAGAEIPAGARALLADKKAAGRVLAVGADIVEIELDEALRAKGVVLLDLAAAAESHPDLVMAHLGTQALPAEAGKFAALNGALWASGVFLYVPRGVRIDDPIRVARWIDEEGTAVFPRTLIIAEAGSHVAYVEEFGSPDFTEPTLSCGAVEVFARDGADVQYVALQQWGKGVRHLAIQKTIAEKDSNLDTLVVNLGGSVARVDLGARLEGTGARSDMLGLYFATADQHFDHNTRQDHVVPHATSDLLYKGALFDEAKTVFRGIIRVHPKAQKTDAYQTNRNLLLSPDAEVVSLPNLEIEADDVRCSHGSTTGQLNEDELFYLMSRGLSHEQAMGMIVNGFIEPVTRTLPMEYAVEWSRLIELQMEGSVG